MMKLEMIKELITGKQDTIIKVDATRRRVVTMRLSGRPSVAEHRWCGDRFKKLREADVIMPSDTHTIAPEDLARAADATLQIHDWYTQHNDISEVGVLSCQVEKLEYALMGVMSFTCTCTVPSIGARYVGSGHTAQMAFDHVHGRLLLESETLVEHAGLLLAAIDVIKSGERATATSVRNASKGLNRIVWLAHGGIRKPSLKRTEHAVRQSVQGESLEIHVTEDVCLAYEPETDKAEARGSGPVYLWFKRMCEVAEMIKENADK